MTRILVAYATKHHATEEIAYAIADVLQREPAIHVYVWPVQEVSSIAPYDTVILGSAVYMGQWQPEALDFLRMFADDLAQRPTWLFSSGPTGSGEPKQLLHGWTLPDAVKPYADQIHPCDVALFHGRLATSQLNILERALLKVIKAPMGDFREWDNIRAWAEKILRDTQHAARVARVPVGAS